MTITELNPKGNFDAWDASKLKEIKKGKFSETIGEVLYESAELNLWQIELQPFERLPFRIHRNNYSCVSLSDGLALSRNVNGQIILIRLQKGKHFYKECSEIEMITDFENVGEDSLKIAIVEEIVEVKPKAKNKF
ncbi:hypothetical protein FEE95_15275 [Maribacter algarum]|uniref:Uncharacterized protein n=1 Tax=Maribacter algarum (ex Zhang et al. 2020) TaxID=2578118 RepID=A0A5S3PNE7_9FLAO|nr:hypothetical protein [Maribacter algarum]TMM56002.1 hypothetical protein FEE95_15275 [Maribacter algarum]